MRAMPSRQWQLNIEFVNYLERLERAGTDVVDQGVDRAHLLRDQRHDGVHLLGNARVALVGLGVWDRRRDLGEVLLAPREKRDCVAFCGPLLGDLVADAAAA